MPRQSTMPKLAHDERGMVVFVNADGQPTKVIRKGLEAPIAAAALLLAANLLWDEAQAETTGKVITMAAAQPPTG